jgi:hypothetical protein
MKETVKRRRNMSIKISGASVSESPNHLTESWIEQAARLEKLLTLCPRDILFRCDLASVLEELGQYKEAFYNWKAVLADDSNNLKAREGMARCRLRIGHPL